MSTSAAPARDQIRSLFDRWQNLEEEKKRVSEDLKELFAEAKGNGLDTKALRLAFRIKNRTAEEANKDIELQNVAEVYLAALGSAPFFARVAREEPPPQEKPRAAA